MRLFLLFITALTLTSCSLKSEVMQQKGRKAELFCRELAHVARSKGLNNSMSTWAKCKKEYYVPLEAEAYRLKLSDVTPIYDQYIQDIEKLEQNNHLYTRDQANEKLKTINKNLEEKRAAFGMTSCIKWQALNDGTPDKICQIWVHNTKP